MNSMHRSAFLASAILMVFVSQGLAQETSPRERELEDRMVNTRLVLGVKKTYENGLTSSIVQDTTWLGQSYTDHWSAADNWWNLYTGDLLPTATTNAANAMWDWDHPGILSSHGVGDSLAGWWPIRRAYDVTGGLTLADSNRPWWALDIGNQVNYVINQATGAKRTKGVVGVWHSDPGNGAGSAVTWTPLSGTRSAWCGLRQHGDNSVTDAQTGNPFNQSTMEFNGPARPSWKGGTASGFPGYASQWDQMLYRDFQPPGGQPITFSFKYRTRMSTGADRAAATRTGWFHGDPLATVSGNFISSTSAGVNAPVDSFSVYAGVPVNDAACVYSDGVTRAVYDSKRRWFSEVLRIFEGPSTPHYELFSASGTNPSDTLAETPTFSTTLPAGDVDAIRMAPGNTGHLLRLVFRVKTNRGYDDESSATSAGVLFTSHGRGAAIIDDVTVDTGAGAVIVGDFEMAEQGGVNAIDNRFPLPGGLDPTDVWRSTGKPPAVYFHPHDLSSLEYADVCGSPSSPLRLCDLSGSVISAGNHDQAEAIGGYEGTAERELMTGMVSPTINLVTSGPPNSMGITPEILDATDDWYLRYDVYTGIFDRLFTGCAWTIGFQSYPATQWNGTRCWGPVRVPDFQMFNPEKQCFYDVENGFSNGLIVTSKSDGIPDSLRLYIGINQQCFRFGVTLGCLPTSGGYFDNVALGFVDIGTTTYVGNTPAWQAMSLNNDQWFGDAFPFNHTADPFVPAQFDTTSALVKTDLNIAPCTGNIDRAYVLGDSAVITAPGEQVRVDLVFRIRPGPGNCVEAGRMGTGLRKSPTNAAQATPGDHTFWGEFLGNHDGNSGFGTPGGHTGGQWNTLVWNSARCDTAEKNLFPLSARGNTTGLTPGIWASTYHEDDPKFMTLGSPKFRCFVVDTAGAVQMGNIACEGTSPAWLTIVPQARSGYDGNLTTREFTKILPDGMFTPGTNIQYFYRKSRIGEPATQFMSAPDTNVAWPQRSEGQNFDLHRFASMSVLPDQWSVSPYDTNATVFDKGTLELKYDLSESFRVEVMAKKTGMIRETWCSGGVDLTGEAYMYGKAGLGLWLGGPRGGDVAFLAGLGLGFRASTSFLQVGWERNWEVYGRRFGTIQTTTGTFWNTQVHPDILMLRRYALMILDAGSNVDGLVQPYRDNPLRMLELASGFVFDRPTVEKGLWVAGRFQRWVAMMKSREPQLADWEELVNTGLRFGGISGFTGGLPGPGSSLRLTFESGVPGPSPGVHGLWEPLGDQDDILELWPGPQPQDADGTTSASGQPAAYYEDVGINGPYIASVYTPWSASHPCITLVDAFSMNRLIDRTGSGNSEMLPYAYRVLTETFGPVGQLVPANQVGVEPGDVATLRPSVRALGNPVRSGGMTIHFTVPHATMVEASIHDIAGRRIRTVAQRSFAAGEHDVRWDCRTFGGQVVSPGVYLLRVQMGEGEFTSRSKVVVLR